MHISTVFLFFESKRRAVNSIGYDKTVFTLELRVMDQQETA